MDKLRNPSDLFESFSMLSVLLLVLMVFSISINLGVELGLVFLGFTPVLIVIGLTLIIFEESKFTRAIIWFVPFIIVGIFSLILTNIDLMLAFDTNFLALVNVIFSFMYLIIGFGIIYVLDLYKTKKLS